MKEEFKNLDFNSKEDLEKVTQEILNLTSNFKGNKITRKNFLKSQIDLIDLSLKFKCIPLKDKIKLRSSLKILIICDSLP